MQMRGMQAVSAVLDDLPGDGAAFLAETRRSCAAEMQEAVVQNTMWFVIEFSVSSSQ